MGADEVVRSREDGLGAAGDSFPEGWRSIRAFGGVYFAMDDIGLPCAPLDKLGK